MFYLTQNTQRNPESQKTFYPRYKHKHNMYNVRFTKPIYLAYLKFFYKKIVNL